jgi:hypothetical protein
MSRKTTIDEFIKLSKIVHGDKYDYSLITFFPGMREKIPIVCPLHGIFYQMSHKHCRTKQGCPKCANSGVYFGVEEFKIRSNKIHGNIYDYSLISHFDNTHQKIPIICSKHGVFYQKVYVHLQGHGCPNCRMSIGEAKIANFLKVNNINFEPQKRFKNCKNKRSLPFDFYLPDYNVCIEYQGRQHFEEFYFYGGSTKTNLKEINERDLIKANFCKENGIILMSLSYKEMDKIGLILSNFLRGNCAS